MARRCGMMPKAILELEMPRNCKNCPLKYYLDYSERNYPWEDYACTIIGKGIADKGRLPDCPLKLADEHCRKAERVNGKCKGYQVSRWNYDPIPKCKNCKDFEEYKEV
jgi:hypothetical protein